VKKPPPAQRRPVADDEPRRIAAKPRKRTEGNDYEYGDMGNTGGARGGRGNKLLNPEANRVQIWRPTWDKNIPTTVRILPALDYDDTSKIIPYRRSTAASKFTPWCFGCPSVQYVGIDTKYTFLLYHPAWQKSRSYDPSTNPYQILFDEFKMAIKNDEARLGKSDVLTKKWYGLAHDSKNSKRRAFSTVKSTHFYKVFIYAHKDKYHLDAKTGLPFGANKRDPTLILCVTKTAGDSLQAKLNRKVAGVSEDAPLNKLFEFGDITGLKYGKFVTFLGPDHVNSLDFSRYGVKVTEDSQGPDLEEEGDDEEEGEGGGDDAFNTRWRTHLHKEFTYVTKNKKRRTITGDISNLRDVIIQRHEWWEDVLFFPTHEQICVWLATAFRSMPNIIRYGWRDNREFMTDEVKGILAARTQGPGAEVPSDDDDEVADDSEVEEGDEEGDEEEDRPRRDKPATKVRRAASVSDEEEQEGDDEVEDYAEEGEDEEGDAGDGETEEEVEGEAEAEEEEAAVEEEEYEEPPARPQAKKPVNRPEAPRTKPKQRVIEDSGDEEEAEMRSIVDKANRAAKDRAARRNGAPVAAPAKKKPQKLILR